jgi:hypothetical protein
LPLVEHEKVLTGKILNLSELIQLMELEIRGEKINGWRNLLAYTLSTVFYPLVTLPIGLATFLIKSEVGIRWALISLSAAVIPILGYVGYRTEFGNGTTLDREGRKNMYLFSVAVLFLNSGLLFLLNSPETLQVISLVAAAGAGTFTAINSRIKISVHTGCAAAATGLNLYTGLMPLFAFSLVSTSWARLELERHDIEQVLAGILIGLAAGLAAALTS